jgi:ABC-type transport system substrate-binding protein
MSPLKPTRRRVMAATAAAAAVALLATACSSSGSDNGGEGLTLVAYTGQAGDYQINFNPFSPSNIGGVGTIYEPLFYYNKAQVSEPKPLLGTEMSWNEDGTELTVTLREGVTWSDGEAFSADDVAFTFNLLKENPEINGVGFDGEVTVVDDTHLTFAFDNPAFVSGPDLMTVPIVPEHLWKDVDPAQDVNEEPIGTGAYLLEEFKPQAISYKSNPDYWGGEPAVKHVRFDALAGNQSGADGIAAGTIDWMTGPVPDVQNLHENFPDYEAFIQQQNQIVLATCSNTAMGCEGPQTDPAVRQALYYAMAREQTNNLAFQGTAGQISPAFTLTPTQDEFVSDGLSEKAAPAEADPGKAQTILEDAGWVKGEDGFYAKDGERLSMTIELVSGWTDYITAVDTIASQTAEAGIEVKAAQSSWNEWTEKKGKGNFELVIDSLNPGPASDPYYVYKYFFDSATGAEVGESAGTNYSRYANSNVDEALEQLTMLDPGGSEARQPYFDAIQAEIVRDMPYIPVLTNATTSVWNTAKFSGWPSDEDLYAFPAVWSAFDAAEIFKHLEPQA